MKRVLMLAVVAGGGFWAYKAGHLQPAFDALGIDVKAPFDLSGRTDKTNIHKANIRNDIAHSDAAGRTKEEAFLYDNIDVVEDWAMRNITWVAAMMWAESRGNPNAVSPAGAVGLMQVMPGTAQDLYRWGYQTYQPTPENLKSVRGSIYFGTSYLEYLSEKSKDREWIARAYNAGPAGKRSDGTWPRETVKYLVAIKQKYTEILTSKKEA